MRARSCPRCGRVFATMNTAQRLCRVCEFEGKGNFDLALAEEAWLAGYKLGAQRARATAPTPIPTLGLPLIVQAIALCHPDRHPTERYELANSVTTALISARNKLRDERDNAGQQPQ